MTYSTVVQENSDSVTTVVENTLVVPTNTVETVLVTETEGNTVSIESSGIVISEEEVQSSVVLANGPQGPQGPPGPSTQLIYVPTSINVGGNRAVSINTAGLLYYPDPATEANPIIGITTYAGNIGDMVEVQLVGIMTEPSWNWVGNTPIYLASNGALTQTTPTTGILHVVGFPIAQNRIFIEKQPPVILG
jgi:hypothetical protein